LVFGEYFHGLRTAKGKTQKQIAEAIDKTTMYISGVESGKNGSFQEIDLEKIAVFLGLTDQERTELYRIATLSRNKLPSEIVDYVITRDRAYTILQMMQKRDLSDEELERIQKYIMKIGEA
jgi:transcriptional regulator with XRE-family HTH domain